MTAHGLIDTTEMYLRTIFELEEEGIVPLRARIAERLGQSGPTVSQTVARMERDRLLRLEDGRQLVLTEAGRMLATQVMRKHRLAECLLVDVIGLPWEEVHVEACRWEHVISEQVERKLAVVLEPQQAIALHARHGLADGRPALPQPLGDPGPERGDALLLQLEDGPQIHLRGIDQPMRGHRYSSRSRWYAVRMPTHL